MNNTKSIAVIKPLRTSAASLRRNIRKRIGGRYDIASVLSLPKMLYFAPEAGGQSAGTAAPGLSVALNKSERFFLKFAAYFGRSSYSENSRIQRLGYLSENLFRSYAGLNRLTQALWSIYRSNNLQLSQSLLSLIRTINEKNGVELNAYFDRLSNVVYVQRKMISVLKSVDLSLFERLSAVYGSRAVLNIGRYEIHRHAETITRGYGKAAAEVSKITENVYTMTPLLMRIYEGIETGVYLYNADTYRNAKTLQRLTNSLWKVYLGQNMELSRSFARLITRVNQENKTVEQRNAENNMFSDNRSLKNLVNALKRAFSGSNLELRNSMITLFGDIHNAGKHRNVSVNKNYRSVFGISLIHKEIVPENVYIRLDHRRTAHIDRSGQSDAYRRLEREIKTRLDKLENVSPSLPRSDSADDIAKKVLEQIDKKQRLDWRLEKLQRGIF